MSITDIAPGAADYPEHDHSAEGIRLLVIDATRGEPYEADGTP